MSSVNEKCAFCNRLRNNLNKTNWNRHKTACEQSSTTQHAIQKDKAGRSEMKCKDIKSFFSSKRLKTGSSSTFLTPTVDDRKYNIINK